MNTTSHGSEQMNQQPSEDLEQILRVARPRLIARIEPSGGEPAKVGCGLVLTFFISEIDLGWEAVESEGYDATHSPLGCPVYWRIVTRAGERLYLTTFLAAPALVIKAWGKEGLSYRNLDTGMTAARLETLLSSGSH
jgi:hypothetical protein